MRIERPLVLCLSGHDPSGGAGAQADIETIAAHQCHAVSVITTLTEQDSNNVKRIIPQQPDDIINQALTVLADMPVKAIKIGLLGCPDVVRAVHTIVKTCPGIPVVLDPILAAGGGADLAGKELIDALVELLLPVTTMLTPNSIEARRLCGVDDLAQCGLSLLAKGCLYVLITGTHESTHEVCNQLFADGQAGDRYQWVRLPHSYHGSGCTLASSIAALLAKGADMATAVQQAQDYTWNALQSGFRPGHGQHIPNRFYRTTKD